MIYNFNVVRVAVVGSHPGTSPVWWRSWCSVRPRRRCGALSSDSSSTTAARRTWSTPWTSSPSPPGWARRRTRPSQSLYFYIMSWFHQHSIHSSNGYWDNQSLGNENFDETRWLQLKVTRNILSFHISGTQKIKLNRLNWRRKEFLCWLRWELNISKLTVINACL